MPLFKYVTLDRIDILVNQEIRYTQLGAFNDPFEMPVYIEQAYNFGALEPQFNKKVADEARKQFKMLSPYARSQISFSRFHGKAQETTKPLIAQYFTETNEKDTIKARETLRQAAVCRGVLSLTETPDNLLMWSHYAAQHTGMVIEFDELHSIFDELTIPKDNPGLYQKVVYSDSRPIWKNLEDRKIQDFMLTKSKEWAYEKEWRIVKELRDAKCVIPTSPHDICLFDMPTSAIKRVILGARVNPEDRDSIKNTLRTTPHLRHIRLQQASLDERRFALNFVDY